ncbi:MAG: alpha-hydroxy-acid oxidizing protein [Pseudomonadota bacterium]
MSTSHAQATQGAIYIRGAGGETPIVPTSFDALEALAQQSMSEQAFAYIAGGAGEQSTLSANRASLEHFQIAPTMLRDVGQRDLSTTFLGRSLPHPLMLCPIGVLEMADRQADLAVGRAAAQCAVPYIFSNQASVPMETVAHAMGDGLRYFQLYWSQSDELVVSLVQRAEACGCQAIVVTLDTTQLGWRTRDLNLAYLPFLHGKGIAQYTSDPVFRRLMQQPVEPGSAKPPLGLKAIQTLLKAARAYPGSTWAALRSGDALKAVRTFVNIYSRPTLTWDDLGFLREHTRLPIVLKGIQRTDDARRAVDAGMDGIFVSNHGGRQVDGAVGSAQALARIAEAVGGQIDIGFDSGVRAGADVVKAIALGAQVVGIGRPYCYALAVAGQAGVACLLNHWLADVELTMGLSGIARLQELNRACLIDGKNDE